MVKRSLSLVLALWRPQATGTFSKVSTPVHLLDKIAMKCVWKKTFKFLNFMPPRCTTVGEL